MKKTFLQKLRELNSYNLAKRLLPGYVLNNLIFRVAIGLVAVFLILAGWSINWGWSQIYYECKGPLSCENPYYTGVGGGTFCPETFRDKGLCDVKVFSPGFRVGAPPGFWYRIGGELVLLSLLCAVVLNHLVYNRGYRRVSKDVDAYHKSKE